LAILAVGLSTALCQGVGAPIRSARLSAPIYCEVCRCSNVVADGARATITLVATFRNRRAKAILIYRRTDTRRTPQLGSDTPRLRARSNSSVKETDMPIENCEKMDARGMPIQKCLAPHGPVNRRRRLRAERANPGSNGRAFRRRHAAARVCVFVSAGTSGFPSLSLGFTNGVTGVWVTNATIAAVAAVSAPT